MSEHPRIADFLAMGERRSKWGLAYTLNDLQRRTRPMVKHAYGNGNGATSPEACEAIAERFDRLAATARECARLAREENSREAT